MTTRPHGDDGMKGDWEQSGAPYKSPPPLVSVIVVATNELHHLRDCLPSLALLDGPSTEVIVVDNVSTDGTDRVLAMAFPWVRVVATERRLGYAPANNLGFRHARGTYLIVLNPDTRVDPSFARALVETSQSFGDRVLVTSRVCLFEHPTTINTCGNLVQFGLLAACRGLGAPVEQYATSEPVASISGCAFLIPRSVLQRIGPFDESIYPYLEDTELSLRAWMSDVACVTAPASLVYHKYGIRLSPQKFFFIERNRWVVMLRIYRFRTILVLLPGLVAIEAVTWFGAAMLGRGHLLAKAKTYAAIVAMLPTIRRGRRELRLLRRNGDRAVLRRLQGALPVDQLVPTAPSSQRALKIFNRVMTAYLSLALHIIRW